MPDGQGSWPRLTATAVFAPRSPFAAGFLTDQRDFLASLGATAR
ncbi:hypothetical protein [Streptomyces sp. NPDC048606]